MTRRVLLPWVLVAGLAAGCVNTSRVAEDVGRQPNCTSPSGTLRRGVLIMAQSVPSASWLPCIRALPPGWTFDQLRPRDGEATMFFNSDRDGRHALTVLLRPSCDVSGATEVPSEHPEMRRYERVTRVSQGYGGERHYMFLGGCVTLRFDLQGPSRAEPVAAISESLGFLSRRNLDEKLSQITGDRLRLDSLGAGEVVAGLSVLAVDQREPQGALAGVLGDPGPRQCPAQPLLWTIRRAAAMVVTHEPAGW